MIDWIKRTFSYLRMRLVLLVLLASIPALALTLVNGVEERARAAGVINHDMLRLARFAARTQEIVIENTRSFLVALSHMPDIYERSLTECDSVFAHLLETHYPYYTGFYLADLKENVICSAPSDEGPENLAHCLHYQQMLREPDFQVSTYHFCRSSGKAVIAMGYPVLDRADNFVAVVNVGVDLKWFNEFAAESELLPGSTLTVLDSEGIILAHYPDPENWVGLEFPDTEIHDAMLVEEEATTQGRSQFGGRRLYAYTPLWSTEGNVFLVVSTPVQVAYADANRTMARNLLLLGGATVLAAVAAWLLGEVLVTRQTGKLLKATRQLAAGNLEARSNLNHEGGEIGQLADAFDHLAENLQQNERDRQAAEKAIRAYTIDLERSHRDLQSFAYAASHDLQEPLRKVQIFADLLNRRYGKALDERGRKYIDSITYGGNRMQKLLNNLLSISRLSTRAVPFKAIDLNKVVENTIADLELQIETSKAKIHVDGLPTIEADEVQMGQLFTNLISNAIKFHKDDQPPVLNIFSPEEPDLDHNMCTICVQDNGLGFDMKYQDRIFLPFERLHNDHQTLGTGIGLTICRHIVERHGGDISAESQPGQGTTFTFHLPVRHSIEE